MAEVQQVPVLWATKIGLGSKDRGMPPDSGHQLCFAGVWTRAPPLGAVLLRRDTGQSGSVFGVPARVGVVLASRR